MLFYLYFQIQMEVFVLLKSIYLLTILPCLFFSSSVMLVFKHMLFYSFAGKVITFTIAFLWLYDLLFYPS